jgi:hypothetical protein
MAQTYDLYLLLFHTIATVDITDYFEVLGSLRLCGLFHHTYQPYVHNVVS